MDCRKTVLIVDDAEINRSLLTDMLESEYRVLEAANGYEAVNLLERNKDTLDIVLLDIVMPDLDGFGVLEYMNDNRLIEQIPVITISAENTPEYMERAFEMGVMDYICRPFDTLIVRKRVENTIMLYAKQKRLSKLVERQIRERQKSDTLMISILSHIVEFRNGESGYHVVHMHSLTELLLRRLRDRFDKYNLTDEDITRISIASALHDIGKIGIPENILNKPGKLTPQEFSVMKTHSELGAEMLNSMEEYRDDSLVRTAYEICRWHHERWDGGGYPDGLKGDQIPLSAQIVSIADVYDALTSRRVYKEAYSHDQAMDMILGGECGSFNPDLLECLRDVRDILQEQIWLNSMEMVTEKRVADMSEDLFH